MRFSRPLIVIIAALLVAGGAAYWYLGGRRRAIPPPPSVESVLPKQFLVALKQQQNGGKPVATPKSAPASVAKTSTATTKAANALPPLTSPLTFTTNGRGQLHISAQNTGDKPNQVALHAGEIYENDQNKIVLLEDCIRDIPPHGMLQADVRIASINLSARSTDDAYKKSNDVVPKLDELITQLKTHPDLSHSAVQTAILLLAENPSLDVFAKFPRLHEAPDAIANSDFKVDTADIIAALQLLADMGVTDRAIASDHQLNIEAMIDQKAHDLALRYYGIEPDMEWAYWKQELLEGDPSLRHYALYGIAEYYPDVALQMLPKWARETRLPAIYRLSAVRAMAMTHRQEAIPILQKLEQEFGANTDLYRSADHATKFLVSQFNQPS